LQLRHRRFLALVVGRKDLVEKRQNDILGLRINFSWSLTVNSRANVRNNFDRPHSCILGLKSALSLDIYRYLFACKEGFCDWRHEHKIFLWSKMARLFLKPTLPRSKWIPDLRPWG